MLWRKYMRACLGHYSLVGSRWNWQIARGEKDLFPIPWRVVDPLTMKDGWAALFFIPLPVSQQLWLIITQTKVNMCVVLHSLGEAATGDQIFLTTVQRSPYLSQSHPIMRERKDAWVVLEKWPLVPEWKIDSFHFQASLPKKRQETLRQLRSPEDRPSKAKQDELRERTLPEHICWLWCRLESRKDCTY